MANEVKLIITTDSSGAITGIRNVGDKLKDLRDETHDATSSMSGSIGGIGDAWGLARRAMISYGTYKFADAGLEYLGKIETASLGIAAAYMTGGTYIDTTTGKVLEGERALRAAQIDSRKLVEELQYANLQTIATLDQLIVAYQQTLPVALAKGFNVQQVKDFTVAMVQAAGAIGLPMDQLAEETRSLLTGNINPRNSRIATVLGLRNEDIAEYKENANGLFNFLMSKLDAYKIAGIEAQNTWAGLWSNQKDIALQFLGQGLTPLFEGIKYELQGIIANTVTLDETTKTIKWNPQFLSVIESVKDVIIATIAESYRLGMLLDKIGGTLTTIMAYKATGSRNLLEVAKYGLSPTQERPDEKYWLDQNKKYEEKYKSSDRALMDLAMRSEGYKQASTEQKAMLDYTTAEAAGLTKVTTELGQVLYYEKEINKSTSSYTVKPPSEDPKEAKKRQKEAEKEAKAAQRVEEQILRELTRQEEKRYSSSVQQAKSVAELKILQGENVLDVTEELYNKEQNALTNKYYAEKNIIEQTFQDEKVKQEKVKTLYENYDKDWQKNESTKAKKSEEYAQKNLITEATLYRTIDQYSEDSVNAEIAALDKKYKEHGRYTKDTEALEAAQSVEEEKIRANAALGSANIQKDYYNTVSAWSSDYFNAVEKSLNAQADLEAIKIGESFDREKWLTEKWKEEYAKRDSYAASFYAQLQNYGQEEHNAQIRLIAKQASDYRNAGMSNASVLEYIKLKSIEAYVKMAQKSDDWTTGVKAGLVEVTLAHTTWGSTAYAVTQSFVNDSKAQVSDNLKAALKGNFNEIGFDWDKMWDTMSGTLSKKLVDMGSSALINKIILYFESSWTKNGSDVLGIVNKVLGYAGDWLTGNSGSSGDGGVAASTYIFEGAEDFGGSFAYGGWVPGSARVSGNSAINDFVNAKLSPDEYVIDRETTDAIARQGRMGDTMLAHINKAEAELLMRLGGAATINPRTGLPEFYTAGRFERIQSDLGDWRYVAPNWKDVGYQEFFSPPDPMNGAVADWTQARLLSDGKYFTGGADTYWIMDPATGIITRQSQEGANSSGSFLNQIAPFISPLAAIAMAPFTGGMSLATLMAITGGGTFAGSVLGQALFQGDVDFQKALLQGGMSAASAGIGRIAGGFLNGSSWDTILSGSTSGNTWLGAVGTAAKNQILKLAIGEALSAASGGSASPGADGHMEVSYTGSDDNGLLKSLAGMMKGMEGAGKFPMPIMKAHKGYSPSVPLLADNEMPVIIESDETIGTSGQMGAIGKKLNQIIALSAANSDRPIEINLTIPIQLDGRVLTEYLYKVSSKGTPVVHPDGVRKR